MDSVVTRVVIILEGPMIGKQLATAGLTRQGLTDTITRTSWRGRLFLRTADVLSHGRAWLLCAGLLVSVPLPAWANPYFEDGYLGIRQSELHEKLGPPQAVRDRKSALRVFTYYSVADWERYFKKLVSPQNGEDVYTYKRNGVDVRYSFSYTFDPNDQSETPTLYVRLVDIEFSPPVPIMQLSTLVPEFRPPEDPAAPTFRSNIWVLLFKGSASPDARFIVREKSKETLDWSLAYQMFSLQGLPDPLTIKAPVDRLEISAQSLQLVKQRQRNTHDPILNPFSKEFAQQAPPSPPSAKKIPLPKYAD